jgi:hypothetical protein
MDGRVTGITPDIHRELAKRTGSAMEIMPLPRKRIMAEFETGVIDMEPSVNPVWRESRRDH